MFWGESGGLFEGFDEAAFVGGSLAGDVEGGAVVDRRADHRQAEGDVDAGFEAEDFDGGVALVVVHGDDDVEITAGGQIKKRVGGEGALDEPAFLLAGLNGGLDFGGFFAAAEEAVLAGVGIDAADADAGVGDAGVFEGEVGAGDGAFDEGGVDAVDGVEQADVGGDVDDAEFWGGEHHGNFGRVV